MNWLKMAQTNIVYQDETGYIKGYQISNPKDYWFISEFVIYPEFRGMGRAKDLAKHIPQKSILLSKPLKNLGKNYLEDEALNGFYRSLGFKQRFPDNPNMLQRD